LFENEGQEVAEERIRTVSKGCNGNRESVIE